MSGPKYSSPEKVFFTSDHHFGHKNICEYAGRPWQHGEPGVNAMNRALIDNWNRTVPEEGIVFHLGDIFMCGVAEAVAIREQLNGQIHLIYGNHDQVAQSAQCKSLFASRQEYLKIRVRDESVPEKGHGYQDVILFHYPIASWDKKGYGSFHLYGHVHGKYGMDGVRAMDVGVDCGWKWHGKTEPESSYAPISYAEVKARLSAISIPAMSRSEE